MFKKINVLFLWALSTPFVVEFSAHAAHPHINHQQQHPYVVYEDGSLWDFVQLCCSHLMGSAFSQCSSENRKALYDRIINDLVGANSSPHAYYDKHYVEEYTHKWLLDFAQRSAELWALSQENSPEQAMLIGNIHKNYAIEKIERYYNSPLYLRTPQPTEGYTFILPRNFFEQFLTVDSLQTTLLQCTTSAQQHTREISSHSHSSWRNFFNDLMEYFSNDRNENPAPEPSYPRPPQPERAPAIPSAPPLEELTCTRLFATQECGASCFTNFKEDNEDRIFLPCGHNFCGDCIKNWFFNQGQSTCPQCRHSLTVGEKRIVLFVLKEKNKYCAGCNTSEGPLTPLICKHTLCDACYNGWQKTAFKLECPRCSKPMYYTF